MAPYDGKPRKIKEIFPTKFVGPKSFQVKKQELTSHIQNYQESFTNAEKKTWRAKYDVLLRAIGQ